MSQEKIEKVSDITQYNAFSVFVEIVQNGSPKLSFKEAAFLHQSIEFLRTFVQEQKQVTDVKIQKVSDVTPTNFFTTIVAICDSRVHRPLSVLESAVMYRCLEILEGYIPKFEFGSRVQ